MGKKMLYIMALVAVAFMVSGWLAPTEYRTEKHIHTVSAGQTIWGIATKYRPCRTRKCPRASLSTKSIKQIALTRSCISSLAIS